MGSFGRAALKRTLALAGIAITTAGASVATSFAAVPTRLFDDRTDRYPVKPKSFGYIGYPITTGIRYEFTRARWRGWGSTSAVGRARLRACPNMAPCVTRTVRMRAYRKLALCSGDTGDRTYTRLRVRTSRPLYGRRALKLKLPRGSRADCPVLAFFEEGFAWSPHGITRWWSRRVAMAKAETGGRRARHARADPQDAPGDTQANPP